MYESLFVKKLNTLPKTQLVTVMTSLQSLPRDVVDIIVSFIDPELLPPLFFVKFLSTSARSAQEKWSVVFTVEPLSGRSYKEIQTKSDCAADCLILSARHGYLSLLEWCATVLKCRLGSQCYSEAASEGNLDVIMWLFSQNIDFDCEAICEAAAEAGHLLLLKWLREHGFPWHANEICYAASCNDQFDTVKWLESEGCELHEGCGRWFARRGNIEALKWMRSKGYTLSGVCDNASIGGQLEVIKWARAEGYTFGPDACTTAARRGNLEILKMARAGPSPSPWSIRTCGEAASEGHLEVLKWLREGPSPGSQPWVPCPWNKSTCNEAARFGHLEVLKWLRLSGCPWSKMIISFAVMHGHAEVVKWIHENGGFRPKKLCRIAAEYGHVNILAWARDNGYPWSSKVCYTAAKFGQLEVLKYLLHGRYNDQCPWTKYGMKIAKRNGHDEVVKWLEENQPLQEDEGEKERGEAC